jgi:hypothetical protein
MVLCADFDIFETLDYFICSFKYIVVMDGNTALTARSLSLMYSGSAIFRQESQYFEFWYPSLKPYVHYVLISYDGSDVLHKLEWARAHIITFSLIASTAKAFAEQFLTDDHVACYWHRLLERYSKLQRFNPTLTADFKRLRFDTNIEVEHFVDTEKAFCNFAERFL